MSKGSPPVITIGDYFPDFSLKALLPGRLGDIKASSSDDYFTTIDSKTYPGKWRVVFFWPKDFTFVCPTEIAEFGRSTASSPTVTPKCSAGRSTTSTCTMPGATSTRIIQFVMVTAGSVGRNVEEVLRVLDALQTEELCACNWRKGAATLDAQALMGAG
jgi:peroxiredoxin (alkyl hydroperoxide reductase subunit C)